MSVAEAPLDLHDGIDGGAQLGRVIPLLGAVVAEVRTADLDLSTPCAAWTTRDLLNHVVGGADMFAAAFAGGPVPAISGRMPDAIGDDPLGAVQAAAGRFGEAVAAPGAMDVVLDLPWGPMTGATFLRWVAFDLLVHTWDLATTLGRDVDAPDDLVAEVDAFARLVLDDGPRDDTGIAAEVPAPDGATPLQRLVAYAGRSC